MNLAPDFVQQYFDNSGNPLAGGLVYTYIAGTTTPLATYTSASGGSANANPVVLDSYGRAAIWVDPTLSYKFVVKDSGGSTIKTIDTVAGSSASGIPQWSANTTYTQGAIVADGTGYGVLYVSLSNGNLNNALTSASYWRVFQGNVRTITSSASAAVTDDLLRCNTTSAGLTATLPACSTTPIGKKITVKDAGDGTYYTSLVGAGSDAINGSTTAITLAKNERAVVINNGTGWDRIDTFVPPGKIDMHGGSTAPSGWLLCNGTSYLRTAFPALYASISTAFGTADGTHFNIPDMRGRFPRGVDSAQARDPDAAGRTAMATGGATGDNVGSVQGHAFQTHTHVQDSHTHQARWTATANSGGAVGSWAVGAAYTNANTQIEGTTATNQNAAASGATAQTSANESRPVNAGVNFIIKI